MNSVWQICLVIAEIKQFYFTLSEEETAKRKSRIDLNVPTSQENNIYSCSTAATKHTLFRKRLFYILFRKLQYPRNRFWRIRNTVHDIMASVIHDEEWGRRYVGLNLVSLPYPINDTKQLKWTGISLNSISDLLTHVYDISVNDGVETRCAFFVVAIISTL